jgi:hypothetical protein
LPLKGDTHQLNNDGGSASILLSSPPLSESLAETLHRQPVESFIAKAHQHGGIDYLQVFEDEETWDRLWFIEDGDGGAIAALLPEEY